MNDPHGGDGGIHVGTSRATTLPVVSGARRIEGALAPVGLALEFVDGSFLVQLWSAGGDGPIVLGPYEDEEVIAIWRRMAADSGLPLLLPGADGALQQPYPQLGRLLIGVRSDRRRLRVLSGRRPRFLTKRRSASLPRRPRVHREVEIASGRAP
jgi:hypothetical protein